MTNMTFQFNSKYGCETVEKNVNLLQNNSKNSSNYAIRIINRNIHIGASCS